MGLVTEAADPPYRWDLVTPDRLGSLLDDAPEPDLWFLDHLVDAAGKALARGGAGRLVFVGRSLDSMFDLLSGALSGLDDGPSVARLPVSFARDWRLSAGRWHRRPLTTAQTDVVRDLLAQAGATPRDVVRRRAPTAFVDVVDAGGTFTELYGVFRHWATEQRVDRGSLRRKLRFVAVTSRVATSPKVFRWQQQEPWTAELPARGVVNVSLDAVAWSYFGNHQAKLTRTFTPDRWTLTEPAEDPDEARERLRGRLEKDVVAGRNAHRAAALAEAVALVDRGRSRDGRRRLARVVAADAAVSDPRVRRLAAQLAT
jgi:hypothetical protein